MWQSCLCPLRAPCLGKLLFCWPSNAARCHFLRWGGSSNSAAASCFSFILLPRASSNAEATLSCFPVRHPTSSPQPLFIMPFNPVAVSFSPAWPFSPALHPMPLPPRLCTRIKRGSGTYPSWGLCRGGSGGHAASVTHVTWSATMSRGNVR